MENKKLERIIQFGIEDEINNIIKRLNDGKLK